MPQAPSEDIMGQGGIVVSTLLSAIALLFGSLQAMWRSRLKVAERLLVEAEERRVRELKEAEERWARDLKGAEDRRLRELAEKDAYIASLKNRYTARLERLSEGLESQGRYLSNVTELLLTHQSGTKTALLMPTNKPREPAPTLPDDDER